MKARNANAMLLEDVVGEQSAKCSRLQHEFNAKKSELAHEMAKLKVLAECWGQNPKAVVKVEGSKACKRA
jgi:hypothetical protein